MEDLLNYLTGLTIPNWASTILLAGAVAGLPNGGTLPVSDRYVGLGYVPKADDMLHLVLEPTPVLDRIGKTASRRVGIPVGDELPEAVIAMLRPGAPVTALLVTDGKGPLVVLWRMGRCFSGIRQARCGQPRSLD